MDGMHEHVENTLGLPFRLFIHSVNEMKLHWHKHMELIFVLSGEIIVNIEGKELVLKEKDLILLNSAQVHSTRRANGYNLAVGMQIDTDFFNKLVPGFSNQVFNCVSIDFPEDQQDDFDVIRNLMARLVYELSKKEKGFSFRVGSLLLQLMHTLYSDFHVGEKDNEKNTNSDNIERLNQIIRKIDSGYDKGITLSELAEDLQLSNYYLSHFIKDHLGMTFQKYLDTKRFEKAISLLSETDMTVTEVSFESGFPNTKSLAKLMKRKYGCTTGEFRKNKRKLNSEHVKVEKLESGKTKSYLDIENAASLKNLYAYLNIEPSGNRKKHSSISREISVDTNKVTTTMFLDKWKELMTFTRAAEGLRSEWRNQLIEIQREIGFRNVRFHGIFSDEMMVYNKDKKGETIYNWSYLDELFDVLMENGLRPYVELGFMPRELASEDSEVFWWAANVSQPKSMEEWKLLVENFILHCIDRYGLDEVRSWHFEVWNEPELEGLFWHGGEEAYFDFYRETAESVKKIDSRLKVGGPSNTHEYLGEGSFLERFLHRVIKEEAPLDFVSNHIYADRFAESQESAEIMEKLQDPGFLKDFYNRYPEITNIYHHKDHTSSTLDMARATLEIALGKTIPIHITEWNASTSSRNPVNDTMYTATYILRNILTSRNRWDMLGYWTFTDISEEFKAGISHFHGGFGLISKEGVKKPSYHAFSLLGKLGNEVLVEGEGYIVTRKNQDIQVLAYNHQEFDEAYMSGDTSLLSHRERYRIYRDESTMDFRFVLKGLKGKYRIKSYKLDRVNGSAFDNWVGMGMPENMKREEIAHLKGISRPTITIEEKSIQGEMDIDVVIPPHGVELVTIEVSNIVPIKQQ